MRGRSMRGFRKNLAIAAALALATIFLADAKPAAAVPLDYVALGDSMATGFGNPPGSGYVDVYRGYAQSDLATTVNLNNLAVNGMTSQGLRNALETNSTYQTAVSGADIVTWNIGGNDMGAPRAQYKAEGNACGGVDNQDCLRTAVSTFKGNWDAIIDKLQLLSNQSTVPFRTMDVYNPFVVEDMADGTFAVLKLYVDEANAYMRSTGEANGIPVAEVYEAFNGPSGTEDPIAKGYMVDAIHPSATGHGVIATLLRKLGYAPRIHPDSDTDGWTNWVEGAFIGTTPLLKCGTNANPADFNNDSAFSGADLSTVAAAIGQAVPPAPARKDIAPSLPDGAITGADLSAVAARIGQSCTP